MALPVFKTQTPGCTSRLHASARHSPESERYTGDTASPSSQHERERRRRGVERRQMTASSGLHNQTWRTSRPASSWYTTELRPGKRELLVAVASGGQYFHESDDNNSNSHSSNSSSSLPEVCKAMEAAFFELCVSNNGRPAAQALMGFVEAVVEGYTRGFPLETLLLELSLGASVSSPLPGEAPMGENTSNGSSSASSGGYTSEFRLSAAGYRLMSAEQQYREQWITIIYLTLSRLTSLQGPGGRRRSLFSDDYSTPGGTRGLGDAQNEGDLASRGDLFRDEEKIKPVSASSMRSNMSEASWVASVSNTVTGGNTHSAESGGVYPGWMESIVDRVIMGQVTGEEQSAVRFDRALATGGASGGVAAECVVIAPQWVPATQLILLTIKVCSQRGQ